MKLLLDECIVQSFRHELPDHEVQTVVFCGWSGASNGTLLKLAADAGFDALITTDRGYAHQHNLTTLPLAIVVLHASTNDINDLKALVPSLLNKLIAPLARQVMTISLET